MSYQVEEQLRQLVKLGVPLDKAVASVFVQRAKRALRTLENDVFKSAEKVGSGAEGDYPYGLTALEHALTEQGYELAYELAQNFRK